MKESAPDSGNLLAFLEKFSKRETSGCVDEVDIDKESRVVVDRSSI